MFTKETANFTITVEGITYDYFPDGNGKPMVKGHTYCPGFNNWLVTRADGYQFVMNGDDEGGVRTRLFFRTNGELGERGEELTITLLGKNEDTKKWDALWN